MPHYNKYNKNDFRMNKKQTPTTNDFFGMVNSPKTVTCCYENHPPPIDDIDFGPDPDVSNIGIGARGGACGYLESYVLEGDGSSSFST